MSKRTYYRGPDASVTDESFVWRTTSLKTYAVRDLRNVGLVRAEKKSPSLGRVTLLAAATVVAIGAGWTLLQPTATQSVWLLAVTIPVAFTVPSMFRKSRSWELHATYRGVEVVLYASDDEQRFNQVARALRRAMEDLRPPERRLRLAAA